jgi:hypothetical protein
MMRTAAVGVIAFLSFMQSACTGLLCIACDGYLGVEGQVYEWTDPPAGKTSSVSMDGAAMSPRDGLVPIQGCSVTAEPWSPRRRPKAETVRLWTSRSHTNAQGQFTVGGTARPGRYDATLTVRCDAIGDVEHVFRHDRLRHRAVVILVRQEPTQEGASAPARR